MIEMNPCTDLLRLFHTCCHKICQAPSRSRITREWNIFILDITFKYFICYYKIFWWAMVWDADTVDEVSPTIAKLSYQLVNLLCTQKTSFKRDQFFLNHLVTDWSTSPVRFLPIPGLHWHQCCDLVAHECLHDKWIIFKVPMAVSVYTRLNDPELLRLERFRKLHDLWINWISGLFPYVCFALKIRLIIRTPTHN